MNVFIHDGGALDYTPDTDTPAGTVVSVGKILGITTVDIAAGRLGAIHVTGVFDVDKVANASSGLAFTFGQQVYWDTANKVAVAATGTNIVAMGECVRAAEKTDSGVYVRIG
jgi:Uncharacterized conserved protein